MFNFLDVVKWNNPQNGVERADVMVVEDVMGTFVQVRHVAEDEFLETSNEKMEDLRFVGRCTAYEKASEVYNRYVNA